MKFLRPLALAGAAIVAAAAGASPAVTELAAEQVAPAPDSDPPGPIAFRVAVTARCGDPDHVLTVAAMLGDTLSAWQRPGDDAEPLELTLNVPRRELGFEPAPLCRRRSGGGDPAPVLPDAFAMQVFARCEAADGRAAHRATAVPLAVRYACPGQDAARGDDEDPAPPPAD